MSAFRLPLWGLLLSIGCAEPPPEHVAGPDMGNSPDRAAKKAGKGGDGGAPKLSPAERDGRAGGVAGGDGFGSDGELGEGAPPTGPDPTRGGAPKPVPADAVGQGVASGGAPALSPAEQEGRAGGDYGQTDGEVVHTPSAGHGSGGSPSRSPNERSGQGAQPGTGQGQYDPNAVGQLPGGVPSDTPPGDVPSDTPPAGPTGAVCETTPYWTDSFTGRETATLSGSLSYAGAATGEVLLDFVEGSSGRLVWGVQCRGVGDFEVDVPVIPGRLLVVAVIDDEGDGPDDDDPVGTVADVVLTPGETTEIALEIVDGATLPDYRPPGGSGVGAP